MMLRTLRWPLIGAALLAAGMAGADGPAKVAAKDVKTTASGLKYAVLKEGKGPAAEKDHQVSVHYTGWLEDGKQFDSSVGKKPLEFLAGRGLVIAGFDEGVIGMKAGEKRQLIIPPKIGYGDEGTPNGPIPPKATLTFEVELVKLGDLFKPSDKPTKVEQSAIKTNPSGLKYAILKPGDGAEAKKGQNVKVHYTGWLENGKKFDSSVDRGQPFQFPLGGRRVIKGWDEGVEGMKIGEKRQLIIPADLGYGDRGAGNAIPPGATLIFEVQLLGAED